MKYWHQSHYRFCSLIQVFINSPLNSWSIICVEKSRPTQCNCFFYLWIWAQWRTSPVVIFLHEMKSSFGQFLSLCYASFLFQVSSSADAWVCHCFALRSCQKNMLVLMKLIDKLRGVQFGGIRHLGTRLQHFLIPISTFRWHHVFWVQCSRVKKIPIKRSIRPCWSNMD